DIVSGVVAALKNPPAAEPGKPPARVLNIGNNRSEKLMDFIRLIEREVGRKADIEFLDMQPGDVKETYADITDTTALTGFKPATTIEQGVPRFVAWYKDYMNK